MKWPWSKHAHITVEDSEPPEIRHTAILHCPTCGTQKVDVIEVSVSILNGGVTIATICPSCITIICHTIGAPMSRNLIDQGATYTNIKIEAAA